MPSVRAWLAGALALGAHATPHVAAARADVSASTVGPFVLDAPLARVASDPQEPDEIWRRYYDHLMAPTRTAPFAVLFTDDSSDACKALDESEEEQDDDDEQDGQGPQRTQQCLEQRERTAAVTKYVRGLVGSEGFPSASLLPVVHISRRELPQAFAMHRVASTPSLMWFPPRATGKLQRQAHPQTNFLAFSARVDVASVAQDVTTFLRRCYAQSGLSFPAPGSTGPHGRASRSPPSVVTVASQDDLSVAETIFNTLPFLAIALYAFLTAMQHRAAVLKVVQSRVTWLVLAQGVLYVSLSGLFHSIIHRVGAFYAHPQYGFYFIHPSGRKQFFLEGLVNGTWSFAISFGLFSIANVMPKVRSQFAREEIFRWALLIVGVAYMGLYMVFSAKHPWLSR